MPLPNVTRRARWRLAAAAAALAAAVAAPGALAAQTPEGQIQQVPLTVGRAYPIQTTTSIARISVANPEVADVAVVGDRDVVINAKAPGETDVIIWATGAARQHLRVVVQSSAERKQVVLSVKFAEVRRDLLRTFGVSGLYADRQGHSVIGTGNVTTDQQTGETLISTAGSFLGVLSDFGTDEFLGAIDAEATRGNARILAEPQIVAANREEASFLAGGEIPIPIAQPNAQGVATVTVQFREFGVRLNFTPEIINDSLVKLKVAPEVSSLDFGNAVLLSGFRIPALRTRRISSTVDVKRNTSLVISGLFNDEREVARTGVPFLMDIPIIGNLFSSTRWQTNESELLVIVTPMIVDPNRPRAQDTVPLRPHTELPAREAIEPRLQPPAPAPAAPARPPAGRPPLR